MHVVKRNGTQEPANLQKIIDSLSKVCKGLNVDPVRIATKVIGGLVDGATTQQIDELTIDKGIWMMNEDPDNSKAMARVLMNIINKEVENQEIQSFSQCIAAGNKVGLISNEVAEFVKKNARKLNASIKTENDDLYQYFGLKTVYDRYLLKHPETRKIFETPQYWLMRVAAGIFTGDVKQTIDFYEVLSSHLYMTSTPTLFNSGTMHTQMSSCYLLDSPQDDLNDIYERKKHIALLSKWAGGIGVDYSYLRSEGSLIKGTNGMSNGIVPFLHLLDASILAVNQGGKRKGAACAYLETFHADLPDFLQLRDQTGDPHRRAHNLNLANWIPDIFMKRVDTNGDWTFMSTVDPEVMALTKLYGDAYEQKYLELEARYEAMQVKPKWYSKVPAYQVWTRMMKTLCETGNGWMCFKDIANRMSNQVTEMNGRIVRSSNLCTEILEVVDENNVAVCNLGSLVLSAFVKEDRTIDWDKFARVIRMAVIGLNKVIDKNYYPIQHAKNSNMDWRPVGLGVMGTQDMLHKLNLCFDDAEAGDIIEQVQAFIYYHALKTSCDLAKVEGKFPQYENTRMAQGFLHFDLDGKGDPVSPAGIDWASLREDIKLHGTRNSLLIAIAPTATIAGIVGVGECTEASLSNAFSRQTLSGEFMQINSSLVDDLKKLGIWNKAMSDAILSADGSVQGIAGIPDNIKRKYRTIWEYSMKTFMTLAARRGRYIDQSQSLNLFMENPTIGKASSMYMAAWKMGLKTTYYFRSRAATRTQKLVSDTTTVAAPVVEPKKDYTEEEVILCSLENPGACEACQ